MKSDSDLKRTQWAWGSNSIWLRSPGENISNMWSSVFWFNAAPDKEPTTSWQPLHFTVLIVPILFLGLSWHSLLELCPVGSNSTLPSHIKDILVPLPQDDPVKGWRQYSSRWTGNCTSLSHGLRGYPPAEPRRWHTSALYLPQTDSPSLLSLVTTRGRSSPLAPFWNSSCSKHF